MQKTNTKHSSNEEVSLLLTNKSREALKGLDGWQSTEDHKTIYREFILNDFLSAVDAIDNIAGIAENEKHHPDIHLTQYRNLRIVLSTHDVGGLSEKDFTVASKINEIMLHPKVSPESKSRVNKNTTKKSHAKKRI